MTGPTLAGWTCTNELGALEDTEVAYELRALAVGMPTDAARVLREAADRLEEWQAEKNRPHWCPACDA